MAGVDRDTPTAIGVRVDIMAFRKGICLLFLVGLVSCQSVFGQTGQYAEFPRPSKRDPFVLETGSTFTASPGAGRVTAAKSPIRKETISSDVNEALSLIRGNYAGSGKIDTERLTDSAIASMLKTLDPHSNFYTPAEFQDLLGEHESEYVGTGSSIASFVRGGVLDTYVISTFPGSPAERVGLKFGDRIVSVDGKPTTGKSPDFVRDLVRGRKGSIVRIKVERAETGAIETVEMKRDRVHEQAVPKGFLVKDNIGYIDLTAGFSNATFPEFEAALGDLHRQGATSLVLDLRGNGGGIVDQAVRVAEKFLPPGVTIVSQQGRYSDDTRTWRAGKPIFESMPLVVLVDENTASASEVLAGALQDNDRALIVGQKTFGKGLVQSVLSLPDGAGLTLTAARYYTPSGRSIQRDYSAVGLYDYFNHRGPVVEIDKPVYAARTVTNRVVYGGDGITPDETLRPVRLSEEQIRLIDPIFFFVKEHSAANAAKNRMAGSEKESSRSNLENASLDVLFAEFEEFATQTGGGTAARRAVEDQKEFVKETLSYYFSMAAQGTDLANRSRIEFDPQVASAAAALPKAARLATAAQKARNTPAKEKSSLSLVLNEQR